MKYLILPFLLLISTGIMAQQGSIKGSVVDGENKATEFANVLLLKSADSALVKGMLSDATGSFLFEGIPAGKYRVAASMVGLGKVYSEEITLTAESQAITVKPLVLAQNATTLKEVVVEGQRPLIEQHLDKTVMNVENSITAAGSNALEVLEKAPGIAIDQNDNISMRGRQGVIVMIDGKQVPMTGSELANLLRGMSANAVDKIELITNPSSKYDAAGNSGIIDIKLKRDKSLGTNGSLSSSFGQGQYAKSNQGVQLNHRTQKFNIFGSYNYSYRKDIIELDFYRQFFQDNTFTGAYDQHNVFKFDFKNHSARLGADYILSPKTTIGVVTNGLFLDIDRTNANRSLVIDAQEQPVSSFLTDAAVNHSRDNQAINFNIRHSIDSTGREISADVDYIAYQNADVQNFETNYYNLSNELIRDPYLLHGTLDGKLTIKAAKADYKQPLNGIGGTLEAGLKSSMVNADNNLEFYDRSNGGNELDAGKSNHFIYEENINAAYLNTSKKWDKASLQLGLRLENTIANGTQLTDGQKFERNYTQLFPSAFLGYNLSKDHELGVSLSRRINRPSYNQLNPFKNFLDPSTYSAGNPFLNPELSYNFELTHTFKQQFITKLSYSHTTDALVNVLAPDPTAEKLVVQTFRNLPRFDYYALTMTVPFSIGSWFNSTNNATFYYALYHGNLDGTNLRNGKPTFNINSNNNIMLPNGWTAEVSGTYRASEVYGFMDVDPVWFASAGIQKQFWDKKASLKLNVSDIFYTNITTATTHFTGYRENFRQSRDTRVATITFNYKFGQSQAGPARRRTGGAEEEKSRAGGN